MNGLAGKVAVVTGGNSGIGKSVVQLFLNNGIKVVVFDKVIDKSTENTDKEKYFIH